MGYLTRLLRPLTLLLRWPLRVWVNAAASPSDISELALDPNQPICYVLPSRSLCDALALELICKRYGLPRPNPLGRRLPDDRRAGLVSTDGKRGRTPRGLRRLVARIFDAPDYAVQIVPVSVFWGRSPEKETSLLRILFADSTNMGRLRKLLVVLANGRNTLVHFGQPLEHRLLLDEGPPATRAARKLMRVLRVHFQRQREATLGPPLSQRPQMINTLLADPGVRAAIADGAAREGCSEHDMQARAADYAREIAADHSGIAMGFMLRVLTWLWQRQYAGVDVRHLARLRRTAHAYRGIIYLPSHRSHMDYLLISYILYREGLAVPQIAAGINLNFWPIGPLLRRCGAFYLRRSIKGNRLYTAVIRAYVDALISRGQPMKFYPEGGRSRTGRLLAPKTGMLSMVVSSTLRHAQARVAVVPVYIGYDRVMEVNKYFSELRGSGKKKNESMSGLLRSSRKVLGQKYGRVYVAFGEPIDLQAWADAYDPDWRERMPAVTGTDRSSWLHAMVSDLATDVMVGINSSATLSAAGLVSLILLGNPQKALAEQDLVYTLDILARLARNSPYSPDATPPAGTGRQLLDIAEPVVRLQRLPHAWGSVLTLDPRQAVLLTYTRNNVMHLFALPSLLANLFSHAETHSCEELIAAAAELYPLLARELFLRWPSAACESALATTITGMIDCGLLRRDAGGTIRRPPAGTPELGALVSLGRIVRESLERYAMTTTLLSYSLTTRERTVERGAFERQCRLMAERMAILTGRNSPEFFDQSLFRNQLQTLVRVGYLRQQGNTLRVEPSLRLLSEHALQLLGPDMRQSISHLTLQKRQRTEVGAQLTHGNTD